LVPFPKEKDMGASATTSAFSTESSGPTSMTEPKSKFTFNLYSQFNRLLELVEAYEKKQKEED